MSELVEVERTLHREQARGRFRRRMIVCQLRRLLDRWREQVAWRGECSGIMRGNDVLDRD
jgi:hypothetical protein